MSFLLILFFMLNANWLYPMSYPEGWIERKKKVGTIFALPDLVEQNELLSDNEKRGLGKLYESTVLSKEAFFERRQGSPRALLRNGERPYVLRGKKIGSRIELVRSNSDDGSSNGIADGEDFFKKYSNLRGSRTPRSLISLSPRSHPSTPKKLMTTPEGGPSPSGSASPYLRTQSSLPQIVNELGRKMSMLSLIQDKDVDSSEALSERGTSSSGWLKTQISCPLISLQNSRKPSAARSFVSCSSISDHPMSLPDRAQEAFDREKLLEENILFFNKVFSAEVQYFNEENGGHLFEIIGFVRDCLSDNFAFDSVDCVGGIRRWELDEGALCCVNSYMQVAWLKEAVCRRVSVCSCACAHDGSNLILGDAAGCINWGNQLVSFKSLLESKRQCGAVASIASWFPFGFEKGRALIIASKTGEVILVTPSERVKRLPLHENDSGGEVNHKGMISVLPNSPFFLYGCGANTVRMMKLLLAEERVVIQQVGEINMKAEIVFICMLDERVCVIGDKVGMLSFCLPEMGSTITEIREAYVHNICSIELSTDCVFFLTGSIDGSVYLWDSAAAKWSRPSEHLSPRGQRQRYCELIWRHEDEVTGLICFKTQYKGEYIIVSGSKDKTIRMAYYYRRSAYGIQELRWMLDYYKTGDGRDIPEGLSANLVARIERCRTCR